MTSSLTRIEPLPSLLILREHVIAPIHAGVRVRHVGSKPRQPSKFHPRTDGQDEGLPLIAWYAVPRWTVVLPVDENQHTSESFSEKSIHETSGEGVQPADLS
jgi:hypothetical protein